MDCEKYFAHCSICGVEFQTDGVGNTICCGSEMTIRVEYPDCDSRDASAVEVRRLRLEDSAEDMPEDVRVSPTGEESEESAGDPEPLEEDTNEPAEDTAMLTGCFGTEEDWSPCGSD
jgi:hypothetical protein